MGQLDYEYVIGIGTILSMIVAVLAWLWRVSARVTGLQTKDACVACRREIDAQIATRAAQSALESVMSAVQKLESRMAKLKEDQAVISTKLDNLLDAFDRIEVKIDALSGNTPSHGRPLPRQQTGRPKRDEDDEG